MRDFSSWSTREVGRRSLFKALGLAVGVVPLVKLLQACEDSGSTGLRDVLDTDSSDTDVADASDTDAADTAVDTTADTASDTTDTIAADAWATGGTAAMTAKATYPDPFGVLGTSCELQCQTTIGPCHTTSPERVDVSDGLDGMPVRLALRVVDAGCNPLEGVVVEIWHTNYKGIYSGQINQMCNSAAEDRAAQYFRGYQRTDADGRVDFDTCFPGWYSGRAVHIHFRVQTGTYQASDSAAAVVISQLFFTDTLVKSIFADEPLYKNYGTPDTLLGVDNIIGAVTDKTPYICDVARMSDGAMLASKTLVVRTSSAANCTAGR